MNLLFIQGGSRVRICENEKKYVDGNFNNDIWNRYKSYCSNLTIILRKCKGMFEEEQIKRKLNPIDEKILNLITVEDVYSPKINFFDIRLKKNIKKVIERHVREADAVIIRSLGNFYTNTALHYCKKYNKKYLIEVTGFAFEGLWYHSFWGKLVAIPREMYLRKNIKKAPYAVYVTEYALQQRYPCKNKSIGCSDVETNMISEEELKRKNEIKISKFKNNKKIKIGTAAFLDVKWKGQEDIIKAIYILKKKKICNFEYELIGTGKGTKLQKLINKYRLNDCVKIKGALKHEQVNDWLDQIDIYVQPSYQEGLCRSIVEAMSRGCPVICTDIGGNSELISKEYLYPKKKINKFIEKLLLINAENYSDISLTNFNTAKGYNKQDLDKKRNEFYMNFING